ncbi:MAG: lysophospholipid acyltransferase family protein [Bosea sp. (in: a-proteobacteria)]
MVGKAAGIIGLTGLLAPFQLLALGVVRKRTDVVPRLYHRLVNRVMGLRIVESGPKPHAGKGVLVIANHVSWLDIPVIGSLMPLTFVAKSEVAKWPLFGQLARFQRTIFIDRSRRAATADISADMGARLARGEAVVLFAEGTTGDGTRILPLRSSLLGAVREAIDSSGGTEEITVQPLTITYVGRNGLPGGRADRLRLAWYGDTELMPHLKDMLSGGPIDVALTWGEPIRMGRDSSRKEATRLAEIAIQQARRQHILGA